MKAKTSTAAILLSAFLFSACASGGLSNREAGAVGGAAAGAGLGAIIGNQSDDKAEGAAIGGAVGGLTGWILGDQVDAAQQRQRER